MAHDKKKSSTGNWKGKRDKHQKADRLNSDKKRKNANWDGRSGRPKKKLRTLLFTRDFPKKDSSKDFTLSFSLLWNFLFKPHYIMKINISLIF